MKFFSLTKASDISQNEIIFLSDVSGDDRIFSVKNLPPFSLGEILAKRKKRDGYRFEIKADSGFYEVSASSWHKFAVYSPDEITARNLSIGDKVLLRGKNSLPTTSIDRPDRISCVSEVLKIAGNRNSTLKVVFGLSQPISMKLRIGRLQVPFLTLTKTAVRMNLSPDTKIEISHEGYA